MEFKFLFWGQTMYEWEIQILDYIAILHIAFAF